MPAIHNLIAFRGEALSQFLLVGTIFGAFAMSGVIALLSLQGSPRLRSFLFVSMALASLAFIFATLLSVLILPFMTGHVGVSDTFAHSLNRMYGVVVISLVLGTTMLVIGTGGVGYIVSRRVGHITLAATVLFAVAFVILAFVLRAAAKS